MSCTAIYGAMEGLYGRMAIQFAKMSLTVTDSIMAHTKSKNAEGVNLQDASLLEKLVKRCRKGDSRAMEAVYERFNRPLFNLIYRYTSNREIAEDLLQDVFIKIFTNLHSLRKTETFIGWMYRIAINTCFGYLRVSRSQHKRTIALNDVKGQIGDTALEPTDKSLKKSLDDAIHSLPNRMKTVFLLHDVQGFNHEEIAPMLGCSVGTSKSQLFKARMKIRESLGKNKVI